VFCINNKNINVNERIKVKEIRLVGNGSSQIVKTKEALSLAREKGLDLVMVSPAAKPLYVK
jgi:translation initiation factor IF-3